MEHALTYPGFLSSLDFLINWPALDKAADLIIQRKDEIDGNHYEYLLQAAEVLSDRHPLAATLALRAMIEFALTKARSKRYRHAASHLAECADLSRRIDDFGALENHATYVARLRCDHGRKYGFWGHVDGR